MSFSQEAPSLIQYSCERCKTRFVLPPSSRKLGIGGRLRAFSTGVARAFRMHESIGESYEAARRQRLAKMDDEAYQAFVQSFRFCHECRQFVCNDCWSASRRSCLTCADKAMTSLPKARPPFAPTGPDIPRPIVATAPPRKGHLRRDIALLALTLCIVLVAIEGGVLLLNATTGGVAAVPTPNFTPIVVSSASATPTATPAPTPTPVPTPTVAPVLTPSPSPSPSATPTPTATATPTPAPTPVPTVRRTATPTLPPLTSVKIACTATPGGGTAFPYTLKCSETSTRLAGDKLQWYFNGVLETAATTLTVKPADHTSGQSVWLYVTRVGYPTPVRSNVVAINANGTWP